VLGILHFTGSRSCWQACRRERAAAASGRDAMSAAKPTLGASDSARLTSCLDAIADGRDASRWSALEQLLYFCDGADTPLLEAIGGKRFKTLAVLVGLLSQMDELGGPIQVRSAPEPQRVPVQLVLRLLESLLCNAPNNLKPFLKTKDGVRLLITVIARLDSLVHDPEGLTLIDQACNLLCFCTFHLPELATTQFVAAGGVPAVARLLQCSHAHYTRTLARPGTAYTSRPPPEGPSGKWDSLCGNCCELVANVASAHEEACPSLTLTLTLPLLLPLTLAPSPAPNPNQARASLRADGGLRSLLDVIPLLTTPRHGTAAAVQPSLTFATEQVMLACSTLVWCHPPSQARLLRL